MTCTHLQNIAGALYTAALRNKHCVQHLRRITHEIAVPEARIAMAKQNGLKSAPARKLR